MIYTVQPQDVLSEKIELIKEGSGINVGARK